MEGEQRKYSVKRFSPFSSWEMIPHFAALISISRKGFITALKDVSVTIPQAVKRGSNALLTCNYDMENDTLYSVKWYKGRREFYRYTPKENPAMKVFPSQSGLNVEVSNIIRQ
uniref:Ig-like domain-containing protein n=1 Tax=Glossina pallidipes TaxID=7398 RepID=A0A1A9ZGZ8_GLOPL